VRRSGWLERTRTGPHPSYQKQDQQTRKPRRHFRRHDGAARRIIGEERAPARKRRDDRSKEDACPCLRAPAIRDASMAGKDWERAALATGQEPRSRKSINCVSRELLEGRDIL
jgi:hypothetical protein